jgi:hypothetical protein
MPSSLLPAPRCPAPEEGVKPLGWVAAPMFVFFVILSTLVLLNLFIGAINENMGMAKDQLEDMKKQAQIKKEEKKNSEDSDLKEIVELHKLGKRIEMLAKRTARLHHAMGIVEFDIKTLIENMELRSKLFKVCPRACNSPRL